VGLRKGLHCQQEALDCSLGESQIYLLGIFLHMDVGSLPFCDVSNRFLIFTFTEISAAEPLCPFFAPVNATQNDKDFLVFVSLLISPGYGK
jgi:hypothetical protein